MKTKKEIKGRKSKSSDLIFRYVDGKLRVFRIKEKDNIKKNNTRENKEVGVKAKIKKQFAEKSKKSNNIFSQEKIENSDGLANSIKKHKLYKDFIDKDGEVLSNKEIQEKICSKAGYNEKPKILKEKEFNSLDKDEYIFTYRGLENSDKPAKYYAEQFKYGENTYGTGKARYGVGTNMKLKI